MWSKSERRQRIDGVSEVDCAVVWVGYGKEVRGIECGREGLAPDGNGEYVQGE